MGPMEISAKQAIAQAWDKYLADTDEARKTYDTQIRAAATIRDTEYAHLHAQHQLGVDEAWETYNESYSQAWNAYQDATKEARLEREYLVNQATPRAITTTAEQWPPPGDTSELPRFVPGDIQP